MLMDVLIFDVFAKCKMKGKKSKEKAEVLLKERYLLMQDNDSIDKIIKL